MEEDAGKSLHEGFADSDRRTLRRLQPQRACRSSRSSPSPTCGRPRMPPRSSRYLRELLVALGVNDGNMEEGSLRCDANVSVRPVGQRARSARRRRSRTSTRSASSQKALEYEIERQIDVARGGGRVVQETRLWDAARGADRVDAQQGGSARLPVLPRARPAAARRRRRARCARSKARCPSCPPRGAGALHGGVRPRRVRRRAADAAAALDGYFEAAVGAGADAEGGEQLDAWASVAREAERAGRRRSPASRACRAGAARRAPRARRAGHDQRLDRQGRVREDVRDGPGGRRDRRAPKGSRRSTTSAPIVALDRRGARGATPTPWRSIARGQDRRVRLPRRPGDEGDRRARRTRSASTSCSGRALGVVIHCAIIESERHAVIETYHLSKLYSRGVYALRDLSLTIDKGEFVFLTGPSGAGKSTLPAPAAPRRSCRPKATLKVARPRPGRAQRRRRCRPTAARSASSSRTSGSSRA